MTSRATMRILAVTALLATVGVTARNVPAAPPPTIDDLEWMSGRWTGMDGTTHMEEVWMAPRGGVMVGMHRDVFGERRFFFESLLIEESADGVVYYAAPRGRQPPTPFRLTEQTPGRAVFSNPAHDFPRVLTYELTAGGQLHVSASGWQDGQQVLQSWTWSRERM